MTVSEYLKKQNLIFVNCDTRIPLAVLNKYKNGAYVNEKDLIQLSKYSGKEFTE